MIDKIEGKGMNESNLWSLSATELRHAYVKRTLSPVEVLESYLVGSQH